MLCCGYTLTDFPISIRLTSLALWQSNDCPSASKATLMNMDKYFMWIHYERLHNHNKAKHNKTVCIFLGIYCIRETTLLLFWHPLVLDHQQELCWPRILLELLQRFLLSMISNIFFANTTVFKITSWNLVLLAVPLVATDIFNSMKQTTSRWQQACITPPLCGTAFILAVSPHKGPVMRNCARASSYN